MLSLTEIAEVSDKLVEARVNSAGDPSVTIEFADCTETVGKIVARSPIGAGSSITFLKKVYYRIYRGICY